jgi:hypothetical protein
MTLRLPFALSNSAVPMAIHNCGVACSGFFFFFPSLSLSLRERVEDVR